MAPTKRSQAMIGQAFLPELNYPERLQATLNRNARRYAAALLGVPIEDLGCWGHMIRKLPGGRAVPWHQVLEVSEDVDESQAVVCPLPAGGAPTSHVADGRSYEL